MNFAVSRIISRLLNRSTISQFAEREKTRSPCWNVLNIPKRCKTRISRPGLFDTQKKHDNYHEPNSKSLGVFEIFMLAVPVSTFLLGTWQVNRLKWKLNLIQELASRTSKDPVDLPEDLEELKSMEYVPVKVKGKFIYEKEFIIGPRSLLINGTPASELGYNKVKGNDIRRGFCVVTPLKLSDRDLTILVNRGWVPERLKKPKSRHEGQTTDEVEIVGVVRLHENRPPFVPKNTVNKGIWYYRDLNAMAEMCDTAPVYIEKVHTKDINTFPMGGQTKVNVRNEHLTYIITWYSLSLCTAYMWHRYYIKKIPFY